MHVLGTCGHVDHGKSTFLRLITGMEPDRLPEEKKRGMTIDLNFVWMPSDEGAPIGIVDVPGHHRFVKNMISGTMQIDAFIFILAADDGWMPQSEEHLEILRGLGIKRGIGVITKTDLVESGRVDEIERLLQDKLTTAFGEKYQTYRFRPDDKTGVEEIRLGIKQLEKGLPKPLIEKGGRLWVDRVFSPRGMGVLVTGTLREGVFREGDEVVVLPGGKTAVIKGLQSYHKPVSEAYPTCRVAVQLGKIELSEVDRGFLVEKSTGISLSSCIDARIDCLVPLARRNRQLSFQIGTFRENALVISSSQERGRCFARIKFVAKVPLRSGDRFVLRTPGGERNIGTGIVVDPVSAGRTHRRSAELLSFFDESATGLLTYELESRRLIHLQALSERSVFSLIQLKESVTQMAGLVEYEPGAFARRDVWQSFSQKLKEVIVQYQKQYQRGPSEQEIAGKVAKDIPNCGSLLREVLRILVREGRVRKDGGGFVWADSEAVLDSRELERRRQIQKAFDLCAGEPVLTKEFTDDMKRSLRTMVKEKLFVSLGAEYFILASIYEQARIKVEKYLRETGQATTSELRELLQVSRKNAVLLLEQMDRDRLTFLKGGVRKLMRA